MQRPFILRRSAGLVMLVATIAMGLTATASAGPGYQPDSVNASIALSGEMPIGLAVDQSTQVIYVAEGTTDLNSLASGQVEQLGSSGSPTANSPFGTGGQDVFVSVAVNPATHGIYAYQVEVPTAAGPKGTSKVSVFSSSGALGSSFAIPNAEAGTLASDSSGRLFFPNSPTDSVQIFNSSGSLEGSITCAGCPGGAFVNPGGVAFNSAGALYVVDRANGGRVVKFAPSGGSYVYSSTLQSGADAVAVAVDSSSNDVFVGDLEGSTYHVVAYDSSGTEFDDFGAGLVSKAPIEGVTGQLAVNSITHRVYLSNPGGNDLLVFERIGAIPSPTASSSAPSAVGQIGATLKATVDPKGHVLTTCQFEYTDHADFLANGFSSAKTASCPRLINQSTATSAQVSGLTPGTEYDYRIHVATYGGSVESERQSFTTLPPLPPEAVTGTASALAPTGATLAGTVNPKGGPISNCHFEWVTEAAFQASGFTGASTKACSPTPTGNVANAVSAKLSGLSAGTAYRFRLVATNNSGVGTATDNAFTTPAETCSENAALCPPEEGIPPAPSPLPAPVITPPPAQPKPLKCRRGYKKKRVHGKLRCVKIKKHRSQRQRS